jgi:hypothetical protein
MSEASSATPAQNNAQKCSPLLSQTGYVPVQHERQESDQFTDSSHVFGHALPPSANVLPYQRSYAELASNHEQATCYPPQFQAQQTVGSGLFAPTPPSSIPDLSAFGNRPPSTYGAQTQLDRLFHQMQATRQQSETHNFDMAMRFGPHNGLTLPSQVGSVGSNSINLDLKSHHVGVSDRPRNLTGGFEVAHLQESRKRVSARQPTSNRLRS